VGASNDGYTTSGPTKSQTVPPCSVGHAGIRGVGRVAPRPDPPSDLRQVELTGEQVELVRHVVDRAVALDDVVAELAEDQVVALAAGDVVVTEAAGTRDPGVHGRVVPQLDDLVLSPPRHSWFGLGSPAGSRPSAAHRWCRR
jgi:hypothetical protein